MKSRSWTFVWIEAIEPTNNVAKRVLRHAVLWRKISGGLVRDDIFVTKLDPTGL